MTYEIVLAGFGGQGVLFAGKVIAYAGLMDTDMAVEMSEYTQQNVLNQAAISVLAQANEMPQQILSLLQR